MDKIEYNDFIMNNLETFVVLTSDIIDSRNTNCENKNWIGQLNILNKEIHEKYSKVCLTPFSLSRGDEIQAVFHTHVSIPIIIKLLRYHLLPFRIRIGVGFGKINQNNNQSIKNSWDLTGTAFFNSRESMEMIKKKKEQSTFFKSNDIQFDEIVNGFYLLVDTIEKKWTKKQWEAVYLYENEGTFLKASKKNNTTPQNISLTSQRANYFEIKKTEELIGRLICLYISNKNDCKSTYQTNMFDIYNIKQK